MIRAEQVKADIGGNLNIASLQDSSTYTSSQQSLGGSLSVGVGKISGSISASSSNINSNFQSVAEQSGIKAGSGGFQVSVAGNTANAQGPSFGADRKGRIATVAYCGTASCPTHNADAVNRAFLSWLTTIYPGVTSRCVL